MVAAPDKPSIGSARINLRNVTVLCVDTNSLGLDVLSQMLMGFGVERIRRAASQEAARAILSKETIDFVVVDSNLEEDSGYDLVRWLRQSTLDPNRFAPVIVTSSHTPASEIASARDCGANFVVAKPLSPSVLMQRMLWIAKGGRQFVEAEKYVGPDRRFKYDGVPEGTKGRRASDLSASLGVAKEPNLNQDQINSVLKPQRVAL
jgi:CheY-like chemotaxis protein